MSVVTKSKQSLTEKIANAGKAQQKGIASKTQSSTTTPKTKSPSKESKQKVVGNITYTKVSEATPLDKFKDISSATSTAVTGRRPGFRAWGQLGISLGQEIFYKNHPEIKGVIESEVTNQMKVSIPEEDDFVTFGVIPAEKHVREHLGSTKNNPQGFDMWGFHLEEDGKVYWRSVYDLYCAVFKK